MEEAKWERLVEKLQNAAVLRSQRVIRAMQSVPRKYFLPVNMQSYSATDTPLPIGSGQTISAPHSLG